MTTSQLPKVVVLLSGGLDSTTLLYMLIHEGYTPVALSVHYGQRHKVELQYAARTCEKTKVEHLVVDLSSIKDLISASALTSSAPVPKGHYAADNMAITVVPNRNSILLSLAYGLAITKKAVKVATAVHKGDAAQYPDCRPSFIKSFEEMEREAITRETYGMPAPQLFAPFVLMSKAEIVKTGAEIGVPFEETYSCYEGGEVPCGSCGTDVERIGAFNNAGVIDPTVYQNSEFAQEVLKQSGEWLENLR